MPISTSAPRLTPETLAAVTANVARPAYDRARLRPRIIHLGLGAFFRAHGAAYTEDVLTKHGGDWGITGVSLQRPDQRDRLAPQNGLYTLIERGPGAPKARIIGCVDHVAVAPEHPEAVVARLASPETAIVTLTVTEKGYCHNPATGRLRENHPDIAHDLANPHAPKSAIGFLVASLDARRRAGLGAFTAMTCDNLAHNGALLRRLLLDLAALRDENLAKWIEINGAFPSTMVDRIVPAATDADLADAVRLTGLVDHAPVAHEPFTQWVIEDHFAGNERPAWQDVGAELVSDVAPYEAMKLRLLNASHSALAYLGYLGGHETIGDCVGDAAYRAYVNALWAEEIIPVTSAPPGVDLADYTRKLLARYDNPAIRHRTWQIAMDGSQKLPQRLLVAARARLDRGLPMPKLALAIAGWMHYVGGVDPRGNVIDVRDPLLAIIGGALEVAGSEPLARVKALIGIEPIFGRDLPQNQAFLSAVTKAYAAIAQLGPRDALAV